MTEGRSYGLRQFEDARWSAGRQEPLWRHNAALRLVRRAPVLDIGGGDGLLLRLLADAGFDDLALVDISPVAVARARSAGFRAVEHDVTQGLPFANGEFATATLIDVLEHVYDPDSLVREAARVAEEVVIVTPNFHYWRDRGRMLLGRVPFQCKPARGHVHWFNEALMEQLVSSEGLEVDERLLGSFTRFGPLGAWLARARPNLFATAFAVRLRSARR